MRETLKIMIVAGEASGDAHGARLVSTLRSLAPGKDLDFFGAAGPRMRSVGVEPTVASDELSVVGIAEIACALPMFLGAKRALERAANVQKPQVVVLIDFPEFNLKLAKSLKKMGFKVVYYISPQLWAWRKYRIRAVQQYVDLLLTILPFEKAWYAEQGFHRVEYVGNPLASDVSSGTTREQFCESNELDPSKPVIALLPGSRTKEIERILPLMINAASLICAERPDAQFVIPIAHERHRDLVQAYCSRLARPPTALAIVEGRTFDALNASDAAAVTSGTATLEAGIIGTPMAIVYRTSRLNYAIIKPLVSVEHFGLINLIAGTRLAAELIQEGLTPAKLSKEIIRLLEPDTNLKMRTELNAAVKKLGSGGASKRAAKAILALIEKAVS